MNSTYSCWNETLHDQYLLMLDSNCTLNNYLRMGFEWLIDNRKMTLFSKNSWELERSRWKRPQYYEVSTVTYPSVFPFRDDKTFFFQPTILKNAI